MLKQRGNKQRAPETFLVTTGNQALFNTAGADVYINNNTTGAVRLASGQLGVFAAGIFGSRANNTTLSSTDTTTHAPNVYIAQGTADSADPATAYANATYPLFPRPLERSDDIVGNSLIRTTKQAAVTPTTSLWVVGDTGALATGGISANDNTTYGLTVAYRGRNFDELYDITGAAAFTPEYTTPDYTALSTAEPVDDLIHNLMFNVNRNSRIINNIRTQLNGNEPVVGMALDLTGSAGTDPTGLVAGNFLPLMSTQFGVRGITLTADTVATIANLPTGAFVLTIDTATAGTTTGGVADAFAIMALDRPLAFEDRIPQIKNRIDLGMRMGFDYVQIYNVEVTPPNEGQGVARVLDLQYRATHGQRKYMLDHVTDPVIEFASPIDLTVTYVTYTIEHQDTNQIDTTNVATTAHKVKLLIPTAGTTTISEFDTLFNAWLTAANGTTIVSLP